MAASLTSSRLPVVCRGTVKHVRRQYTQQTPTTAWTREQTSTICTTLVQSRSARLSSAGVRVNQAYQGLGGRTFWRPFSNAKTERERPKIPDKHAGGPPDPPPPLPDIVQSGPSEKVMKVVDDICALNIVEFNQLIEAYKKKAGITDDMMASYTGGGARGAAPAAAAAEPEAAPEPVAEKSAFSLKVTGYDQKAKIKVIKEVRAMLNLGLKEAKDLVESLPKTIKKDLKKEEAEEMGKKLSDAGAEISIE